MVSYYKLEDVTDSVGANTLTNTGTVTFTAAKIGNGANLGTSNSTKKLSNSGLYQTGSFSISTWVKNETEIAAGQYGLFQMADNTTTLRGINLTYNYNGGTRNVTADYHKNNVSDNNITWSSGALGTSVWTHYMVTYDGTTFTLYANGISVGTPLTISGGGSGSSGTQGFTIGLADRYGGSYASVLSDETAIWSRALSSTEVTELYNTGNGNQYPFSGSGAFLAFL